MGTYRSANVNARMSEEDIREFADWGGNLLRLNFAFCPLMKKTPPHELDEETLRYLDRVIDYCEKHHVYVLIDPHTTPGTVRNTTTLHTDQLWTDFVWHEQLIRLWDHLANRYADRGKVIAGYDLLNEPTIPNHGKEGTPADYNLLVRKLVAAIRKHDTTHTIVIEPPNVHPHDRPWPARIQSLAASPFPERHS